MAKGGSVLLILAVAVVGQALTPTSYFTPADMDRLRIMFSGAQPYGSDLESVYYSILGFSLLDEPLQGAKEACDSIKANVDSKSVQSVFYATATASILKNKGKTTCQIADNGAKALLTDSITEEASTETIYMAVAALTNLGVKVDATKVTTALTGALKNNESPLSHGFAFLAASHLSGDLKKFYDLIEDIIAQADEVEEKYLQLDGGLYTTTVVIEGAYKLAAAAKQAPALSEEKVIKFTNYFLSRKHVQQLKGATALLSVVKTLTDNQFHIPVAVTLASQVSVSEKAPIVKVRVSNLLAGTLGKLTVTADTARHTGDDAVILSKKPFTANAADSSLYELDLMKVKPARGFYRISISVAPQKADKRLIGTTGAEVEVKVTTQVAIESMEMGVADRDQSTAAKTTKLQHPNKAANMLEADHQQKVIMKFQLKDKLSGAAMTAHQVFIRLTNQKSQQEIIFVAESDSNSMYKFDLDVGASAKEFGFMSGKYSMDVIVGDAVIENPFSWSVADVKLTFQEGSVAQKVDPDRYAPRPEIQHMFRQPDARPSKTVSTVFTGLVLLPLLILIISWIKIGANMSNFPMSISAIGFHIGLGAIFALYYLYWTNLNMFDTIRYLGLIGIPTFLFGNQLLSSIAAKRK